MLFLSPLDLNLLTVKPINRTIIYHKEKSLMLAKMNFHLIGGLVLLLSASLIACSNSYDQYFNSSSELNTEVSNAPKKEKVVFPFSFKKGSTLSQELRSLGYSSLDIHNIALASKSSYDLYQVYPGLKYRQLENSQDLEFQISSTKILKINKNAQGQWESQLEEKKVTTQLARFSGTVNSSLWESAQKAQMDKVLIADLTEVFAWQIDFARQVRENDSWKILVEQEFVDNEPIGWGKILAAEYVNDGKKYEAVYFEKPNVIRGYFSPDGKSVEKLFLRSPIEFARISSGFSLRRFHPILKINRPHLGVDYAAAPGTPVRSIGDGRVVESRFNPAGGNTLVISYNSIYKSRYLHLKGFARGIHTGQTVHQGQVVGYVGSTGLATGPHLHFEFYKNGAYRDPVKVELPSAQAIPHALMSEFMGQAQTILAQLPEPSRTIAMESKNSEQKN